MCDSDSANNVVTVFDNTNEHVLQRTSRFKSNVWHYFQKINLDMAQCKVCTKEFKVKYGNTTSLIRHLKSAHRGIANFITNVEAGPSTERNTRITYLDKNSVRAQQLTNAIVRMIALDLQPFSVVDDIGFRTLLNVAEPRYEIPCRTTFSRTIIPNMYQDLKASMKSKIPTDVQEGDSILAFTTDGWTSRAVQSYISLTIHYVTKDFQLNHYMLNLQHLPEKHTHKYIQSTLLNCLSSWNIDIEKPAVFTTDNGRNLVKAINLNRNWTRIPCFAHCLQLAVKSAMKSFGQYEELRKKCRNIVTFFSRSTTARNKLVTIQKTINEDATPLQLIQEVDTRWNSTFAMFQRLIQLRTTLNMVLCDENMPDNLSSTEWNFLESVTSVLEPIKDATEIMSGELYPTLSQYYPMYFGLISVLEPQCAESTLLSNMCHSVRNALKERFDPIIENDKTYIYAMLLDPRFKDHLLPLQTKHTILEEFSAKVSAIYKEKNINVDENVHNIESRSSGTGGTKSKLLQFFNKALGNPDEEMETSNFDTSKNREIQTYFSENVTSRKTDVLDWWKLNTSRFPILSVVARHFLAIPATQVTSERLFSISGNIVTATRTKLLPQNIEELCFLHANLK